MVGLACYLAPTNELAIDSFPTFHGIRSAKESIFLAQRIQKKPITLSVQIVEALQTLQNHDAQIAAIKKNLIHFQLFNGMKIKQIANLKRKRPKKVKIEANDNENNFLNK